MVVKQDCIKEIYVSLIIWNPGNLVLAPNDPYRLGKK